MRNNTVRGVAAGAPPTKALLLILIVTVTVAVAPPVAGDSLLVCHYVEGDVAIHGEAGFVEPGTVLSGMEVLELGADGYVEIGTGAGTIRLAGPGRYELSNLTATSRGHHRVTGAVSNRVRRLTGGSEQRDTVTAGVRGDYGGATAQLEPGGFTAELYGAALDALGAGRMEEAELLMEEALIFADLREAPTIRMDLAAIYLFQGQYDSTISLVQETRPLLLTIDDRVQLELLALEAAMNSHNAVEIRAAASFIWENAPESPWAIAARRILEELTEPAE